MFEFLLTFILFFIIPIIAILLSSWLTHLSMTKSDCKVYGWGSRKLFWYNLKKYELIRDKGWEKSFFNYENRSKFHASIIKFNDIGMLLNPMDWVLVNIDIWLMIKKENKKEIYVWRDE